MLSKTHKMIGFSSLVTAGLYFYPKDLSILSLLILSISNIVGSQLPDIDSANNRLWDLLPGGNLIGKFLKFLFMGHRNLTHSILGCVLVYNLTWFLAAKIFNPAFVDTKYVAWSLLIGYFAHLAADSLTENGLPLFWPLKYKFGLPPIRSLRIKTGGFVENYIIFPSLVLYLILVVANHKANLSACWKQYQNLKSTNETIKLEQVLNTNFDDCLRKSK